MDSDADLLLIGAGVESYLEDGSSVSGLGGLGIVNTEHRGPVTERRFVLPSGLEVEVGVAPPSRVAADPADAGTRRIAGDGMRAVYDPEGILARLAAACRRDEGQLSDRAASGGPNASSR